MADADEGPPPDATAPSPGDGAEAGAEVVSAAEVLPPDAPGGIDDTVSAETGRRIADATPETTKRAYAHWWRDYTAWCDGVGRTALPGTDATLAEYVSHLADRGLSPSSLEGAIATIRRTHRDAGYAGQPDTRGARLVLRTHRRERADAGIRVKQAPPAAVEQLRMMVRACPTDTAAGLRDRALLVLGFALMARRSELVALTLDDVREVDEGLVVTIRKSKTDRDARGAEVAIPYGTRPDTCPVRVIRAWRDRLAEDGITSGPFLRSVDRHGRIGDSLSGDGLRRIVKAAAERAGLWGAEGYTSHSLRAGGATSAAKAGAHAAAIAAHGRWSPTSPVVHTYIRTVDRWRENPLSSVGL
jgi:site-specific recombinase XerD